MKLPVFKLEEYLGEREFSTEILFSASDMESFAMDEILSMADEECADLWKNLRLQYTEPKGHPLLLDQIGKMYQFPHPRGQLVCFAGAEEGIFTVMNTLLDASDHVIVITPCYQSLSEIAAGICEVTHVNLSRAGSEWIISIADLRRSIKKNSKMIIINFPHNPTGAMMSLAQQKELIVLAREFGLYIFSDEVYRELEHQGVEKLPAIALAYEKGISLGVMSKSYGMPGLRVGWIASPDPKLVKNLEKYKYYLSICNSGPSEILSLIALRNEAKILDRNRQILSANIEKVRTFFLDRPDIFNWMEPRGGCIAFPELRLKVPVDKFAEELRQEEGVLILPGSVYDFQGNYFRIGYGRSNLSDALVRLDRYLKKRS